MTTSPTLLNHNNTIPSYDDDFFDDMLGVFPDASGYAPKAGWCSKYIYEDYNWDEIVEHSKDYYAPQGDHDLIDEAIKTLHEWGIPISTPYIDFGVGGPASFIRYAVPMMQKLGSENYTGVDICAQSLQRIAQLGSGLHKRLVINTEEMDLFFPTSKILSKHGPALGVMNGLTLTNICGKAGYTNSETNLIAILKYLSQLCGHGWLLLTIDTNQSPRSLMKAYGTPSLSRLFLNVLFRMAKELPVEEFDPTLFIYEPEFRPEQQLLAHTAKAVRSQEFKLGPYPIRVKEGQKIHLVNSYKWSRSFFESCVEKAGLVLERRWSHATGMMLYLLKDLRCMATEEVDNYAGVGTIIQT